MPTANEWQRLLDHLQRVLYLNASRTATHCVLDLFVGFLSSLTAAESLLLLSRQREARRVRA